MRRTAQKGGFAAVGFPNENESPEFSAQQLLHFLGQSDKLAAGDAKIHRAQFLQNHALRWVEEETPAQPGTTAVRQGDKALCHLCLMGMHRPAAEGIKDLLHLQGRQRMPAQCFQLRRQVRHAIQCQSYPAAHPQTHFVHPFGRTDGQLGQRSCQPAGQCADGVIILVHFASPFRISVTLLFSGYAAAAILERYKQSGPPGRKLPPNEPLGFDLFLISEPVIRPAAWREILLLSARAHRETVPWSAWSLLPRQPRRRTSFSRRSRWPCRRSVR